MKLTREQRARCFEAVATGKGWPKLSFAGDRPCPVKERDTYQLSPGFWLEVDKIVRDAKGLHVAHYTVHDTRGHPRFLRRTPTVTESEFKRLRDSFDEFGYPPPLTEESARREAIGSAYSSGQHGIVAGAGEGVGEDELAACAKEALLEGQVKADLFQARRERHELEARLRIAREAAERRGVDISSPERVIERQLAKIERRLYGAGE